MILHLLEAIISFESFKIDVQSGQRVALTLISEKQYGQTFVVGSTDLPESESSPVTCSSAEQQKNK